MEIKNSAALGPRPQGPWIALPATVENMCVQEGMGTAPHVHTACAHARHVHTCVHTAHIHTAPTR